MAPHTMKKAVAYDHSEEEEEEEEELEQEDGYDYTDESGEEDQEQDTSDEESDGLPEEEPKAAQLEKLKRSLAHVSFEQLAEIKNKMGMKEFSQARRGKAGKDDEEEEEEEEDDAVKDKMPTARHKKSAVTKAKIIQDLKNAANKLKGTRQRATKEDMKRESKHSPMEISSKRKVGRFREVVESAAVKRRDPRFDKLSGQLNQDLFEKSYAFIKDYKQSEQQQLKEQLTKAKDPEERERLKSILTRMKSQEIATADAKRKQALARERKKVEADLVKQGKQPYFLKNSEKRKLELVDKYNQLGEKSMERILEKRRKRNANKDHKRVPFKRRSA